MERNSELKSYSRELRKNQTKEESLLWYRFLSKYPVRFRRQYIIGNYIVDFYCHKARLVVELDGSQHYEEQVKRYDETRTQFLQSHGIHVMRFTNLEILRQFQSVCEVIHAEVTQRIEK